MTILSNVEFEKLVVEQSPRIRAIAKARCDANPTGLLTLEELSTIIRAAEFSGDRRGSAWLKNLVVLAKQGKIAKIRENRGTWGDHVEHVHALHAAKKILFNIGQHVSLKDSGKFGSVVDYIPDTDEYLVVLDPFQIKVYKKNELEKVAKTAATRWWVGYLSDGSREAFPSVVEPTQEGSPYSSVTGPFKSKEIAETFANSPEYITEEMAENIVKNTDSEGVVHSAKVAQLEDEELDDQPSDDDYFIEDKPNHGYSVSQSQKFLESFSDRDEAEAFIRKHMDQEKFWPNVWFVDDHGGMQLITIPEAVMRIKLDNQDHTDGLVLVIAEDAEKAKKDQTIMGSHWEFEDDFAHALISDEPGLEKKLQQEGYEVDDSDYYSWADWDELKENLDDETKAAIGVKEEGAELA